uniref:Uncharacterized protein n=1 Tax=Micrurus corallinus TaxID=54390 RepID=A0A2D4FH21_MICCO
MKIALSKRAESPGIYTFLPSPLYFAGSGSHKSEKRRTETPTNLFTTAFKTKQNKQTNENKIIPDLVTSACVPSSNLWTLRKLSRKVFRPGPSLKRLSSPARFPG